MKPSIICAALLCAGMYSAPTHAANFAAGPYVVASYDNAWPTYTNGYDKIAPPVTGGGDIALGWRFNNFYSVEADYGYVSGSRDFTGAFTAKTDVHLQTGMIDAFGYMPFGRGSDFATFATAGLGIADGRGEASASGTTVISEKTTFSGRVGVGALYQFNENFGIRAIARYQWNSFSTASGETELNLGLVVQL